MEVAKKHDNSFSELYKIKKVMIYSYWIITRKRRLWVYFPQVDPRYGEVLASRQVPRREWHEHQKWVRYYLNFCNIIRSQNGKRIIIFLKTRENQLVLTCMWITS